ncbi:hypothetical protein FRC11_007121 [Ceratobasidium sp. 423]|nr:hypothetical protein FRC11_007121 [Ceratobasidium sp. 423]
MELSQHLFNIQMARYMRLAGESQSTAVSPAIARSEELPTRITEQTPNAANDSTTATNNAGTGSNPVIGDQTPLAPGTGMQEFMERSNQLSEHFNLVLERLTQLVELSHRPADQSHQLAERFNQLLDRFNQLVEQSNPSARRTNELAERSNQIAERANQLAEQAQKPLERLGDMLRNINNVLVGVQHAIVRNHKGNTVGAVDCLVNEKGETPECGTILELSRLPAPHSGGRRN